MTTSRFIWFLWQVAGCALFAGAQTNIVSTNPVAEQILKGNYNPAMYTSSVVISHPDSISKGIMAGVSADSLHAYLDALEGFKTRNSGADTVSAVAGMGAARSWVYEKLQQFSARNENRLVTSYLRFDLNICGMMRHKNVFATLPGSDTSDKSVIIIEAHMDSRCAGLCDTGCVAHGMEDNGSGTALVLELARVMSRFTYRNTLVFLLTTAEEQGLLGAEAFSFYALQKSIKVKAVLNNDVVGGVICGKTASPPGCAGQGNIDSTHVRLFSFGGFSSPHKGLARFIKLQYNERIRPLSTVPVTLHVMTPEDRTGRGGDHIPFRMRGYTSMRFTSANEHGDANVSAAGYDDRQHTSDDILGIDTDNDQVKDSFFVDFNYLARNAVINGNAFAMAAIGAKTPDFSLTSQDGSSLVISVNDPIGYQRYRAGIRTLTYDWDTVITWTGVPSNTIQMPAGDYIVSVAAVAANGVESLFSKELMLSLETGVRERRTESGLRLLPNVPNPADEATMITVLAPHGYAGKRVEIVMTDAFGRMIRSFPLNLVEGINEIQYDHGYHARGVYVCELRFDGHTADTRKMVFTD